MSRRLKPGEYSGRIPVEVVYKHGKSGIASIYKVEFPTESTVNDLKEDMQTRLKLAADCQEWYYKSKKITGPDTLTILGIKRDDKILIKAMDSLEKQRADLLLP